jgi:hypothetical protein
MLNTPVGQWVIIKGNGSKYSILLVLLYIIIRV